MQLGLTSLHMLVSRSKKQGRWWSPTQLTIVALFQRLPIIRQQDKLGSRINAMAVTAVQ